MNDISTVGVNVSFFSSTIFCKSGKLACLLAAVAYDDLIAAILTGTHRRWLIDARRLDRLHKSLHLRIVPDTNGMIFERV